MVKRRTALVGLLGLVALLAASGAGLAAEQPKPKKAKDPYRSIVAKLSAARRKAIQANPELKKAYTDIRAKQKELQKQLDELYKKVDAADPAIDALAKQKAALDAERQRKRDEARAARRAKREKKPRKKKGNTSAE